MGRIMAAPLWLAAAPCLVLGLRIREHLLDLVLRNALTIAKQHVGQPRQGTGAVVRAVRIACRFVECLCLAGVGHSHCMAAGIAAFGRGGTCTLFGCFSENHARPLNWSASSRARW